MTGNVPRIWFILISLWLFSTGLINSAEIFPKGMVLVKGGMFRMGSNAIFSDEEPVHNVRVNSFYIGKFEVTQEEWTAVMGNNPSLFKGDDYPVDLVTWNDAVEFCNKKSEKEGKTPCYTWDRDEVTCDFNAGGYRLPTEAEWEYACRGGEKSGNFRYSGSNNADDAAWYEMNSEDRTHQVGQKKPNELGIYDMSGNVWEWCWDWYDKDYYKNSAASNPQGPSQGKNRSYRGGSAAGRAMWLRSTARFSIPPDFKNYIMGFRIVKNNAGKPGPGMVFIKGGIFEMGARQGTNGEKLVHTIMVDSFYMGQYEVTQEEWRAVMKNNPSLKKGAKSPVNYVDWYEVIEYCNKRSQIEGLTPCYSGSKDQINCNFEANGYRIPTEAEWEYACRGGSHSKNYNYSGSNNADEVAWHNKNSGYLFALHPVGQKKPNELGIYDMSGNVQEWCWDWYDFDYYKTGPAKNPRGLSTGVRRVIRGGHWYDSKETMRCASRSCAEPYLRSMILGFRLVRTARAPVMSNPPGVKY